MQITQIVRLLRPRHWAKNVLVLMPVVFSGNMANAIAWCNAFVAMAAFCLASSAVYVFNDIHDRQADRLHPDKKSRPLASGQVGVLTAWVLSLLLAGASLSIPLVTARGGGALATIIIASYLVLQIVYTCLLKKRMIVDVMCIAAGFVLRAIAGAVAIHVYASPWLIICTFTLCMFVGFCKRRCEIGALGEDASKHRRTLGGYSTEVLSHLITMSASVAVVSFMLYASNAATVARFGTIYLVYTLPAIIYAVFRFAMLCIHGLYNDPTDLIFRDRPFQFTTIVWGAAVVVIIRWGEVIQDWLARYYQ